MLTSIGHYTGDTVTFNYSSGHNVEEVTQEAFDSCTVSSSHTIFVNL